MACSVASRADLEVLFKNLEDFHSVSKALQENNVTLAQARSLFDALLVKHQGLQSYLGLASGAISRFPLFEKALLKRNLGETLSDDEKSALGKLGTTDIEIAENEVIGNSFAQEILNRCSKKAKIDTLKWVKPTSNVPERLFSVVRGVFTDYRKKTTPVNLESQVFLKSNKNFWNELTVSHIVDVSDNN